MWDPAVAIPIFKMEVFLNTSLTSAVLGGTILGVAGLILNRMSQRKMKSRATRFWLFALRLCFSFVVFFHVADMSDVRSRSNSTLPWQWTVCGYFQRPLKETEIEYFLRIIVLGQRTHCMLSSPMSYRLKEYWGLSGFMCWQRTLETEINQ